MTMATTITTTTTTMTVTLWHTDYFPFNRAAQSKVLIRLMQIYFGNQVSSSRREWEKPGWSDLNEAWVEQNDNFMKLFWQSRWFLWLKTVVSVKKGKFGTLGQKNTNSRCWCFPRFLLRRLVEEKQKNGCDFLYDVVGDFSISDFFNQLNLPGFGHFLTDVVCVKLVQTIFLLREHDFASKFSR